MISEHEINPSPTNTLNRTHTNCSRKRNYNLFKAIDARTYLYSPNPIGPFSLILDLYPNPALVSRLSLAQVLKSHTGCVNTVNWSRCGRFLVSGSDDTRICVWDYHKGGKLVSHWETTHTANIFCTKFVPNSDNTKVISCAGDDKILVYELDQNLGSPKLTHTYTCHKGRVKKVGFFDDAYSFISGSEDGTVRLFDIRKKPGNETTLVRYEDNEQGINCIATSKNLFVVGGSDPFARVYDVRTNSINPSNALPIAAFAPSHLIKETSSSYTFRGHITGVDFLGDEILASYSGDDVFLFHLKETKKQNLEKLDLEIEKGEDRETKRKSRGAKRRSKEKKAKKLDVEFEKGEDGEAKKKRRTEEEKATVNEKTENEQGDYYLQRYSGHCNIRTIKGVSFFGPRGEYVASGSDDGRIFIWDKVTAKLVNLMMGDRDVVNVISGHPYNCVMATSGIEKHVKIWEPIKSTPTDLSGAQAIANQNKERMNRNQYSSGIPLSVIRQFISASAFEVGGRGEEEFDDEENSGQDVECRLH